jgi:hypothetical protein
MEIMLHIDAGRTVGFVYLHAYAAKSLLLPEKKRLCMKN